ncbi:hypothetical protein C8J57DRAFT_1477137 [Mycena rebaudengoi]|nr:hypothetical protein C8J57DRAFT_1477137 [Mycena rebaudengoi]
MAQRTKPWLHDDSFPGQIDLGKGESEGAGTWSLSPLIKQCNDANSVASGPNEACAVYLTRRPDGLAGEAIIKLRIQIPPAPEGDSYHVELEPHKNARHAVDRASAHYCSTNEIATLTRLSDRKAAHAPFLLALKWDIPMSKLPGARLTREAYHALPTPERAHVRVEFQEALAELRGCGIRHDDTRLENLMWDADNKWISILDFEEIVWEEGTAPVDNTDLAEEEWSSKW